MDEADIRLEFQHLIREMGFWDYHPPDDTPVATKKQIDQIIQVFRLQETPDAFKLIREILKPPTWRRESISIARPDIYGLGPLQRTVIIECKAIKPKVQVEPYLDPAEISEGQRTWLDAWKFQAGGFAFLGLGTLEGKPRRAWLIPWDIWVSLERREAEKALKFKMPISIFPEAYELAWVRTPDSKHPWLVPEEHPICTLAMPDASPNQVDWKKQYSLRFVKKEEDDISK